MNTAVPDYVLLPGWSMPAASLSPLAQRLDGRSRLLDLPGQGERRDETMPDSMAGLARALEHELHDGAVLLGWSLGALAALAITARGRVQPAALVLITPTPRFLAGTDWPHGIDPALLARYEDAVQVDAEAVRDEFTSLLLLGDARRGATLQQLRELRRRVPAPAAAALAAGLRILREADLRAACATLTTPALVVAGGGDRVTPAGAAHWLGATLQHATIVELGSAGHALPMSHAAELAAAVNGFLVHRSQDARREDA